MIVQKMPAWDAFTNNDPQACRCGTKVADPRKLNSKTPYCGTLEENKNSYQDILLFQKNSN
jgi:hypothetical protein